MSPKDPPKKRPFKAIIVGGGPTGLALAHSFAAAKIPYVLLERRSSIVTDSGAGIVLLPQGARIFDQLGLLPGLESRSSPMHTLRHLYPDGRAFGELDLFYQLERNLGYRYYTMGRVQLVELLYAELKDKSGIRAGAKVVRVEQDEGGVRVVLEGGEVVEGDVVVGADGVHSAVRKQVFSAGAGEEGGGKGKEEFGVTSYYRAIYGYSPTPATIPSGVLMDSHNTGRSLLLLSQPDLTYWFMVEQLPRPHPGGSIYSATEMDAMAARLAAQPTDGKGATFGELYAARKRAVCCDLEEGFQPKWHKGRVVLCGDSAHKMTPTMALGFNNCLESVAALTNVLAPLVNGGSGGDDGGASTGDKEAKASSADNKPVSLEDLTAAFAAYRERRVPRALEQQQMSNKATRLSAWETPFMKLFNLFSLSYMPSSMIINGVTKTFGRGAEILDCVPFPHQRSGRVGWGSAGQGGKGKMSSAAAPVLLLFALAACAVFLGVGDWWRVPLPTIVWK